MLISKKPEANYSVPASASGFFPHVAARFPIFFVTPSGLPILSHWPYSNMFFSNQFLPGLNSWLS
jgi:hypothetical protein